MRLKSPSPKREYILKNKLTFNTNKKIYLSNFEIKEQTYIDLLKNRKSSRFITKKLGTYDLSPLLWFNFKIRDEVINEEGIIIWQKLFIPTSGGLGSIFPLILNINALEGDIFTYSGVDHSLSQLESNKIFYDYIINKYLNFFEQKIDATIFLYILDKGRLKTKYNNYESLAWRDVGVIYQNMNLVSQLYGIKSCMIGDVDDKELLCSYMGKNFDLVGVQVLGY